VRQVQRSDLSRGQAYELYLDRERGRGASGDQRGQIRRMRLVPWVQAGDATIILDADQESPTPTVRQADDGLDQVVVGQRALIALELGRQRLAASDQRTQLLFGHRALSFPSRSAASACSHACRFLYPTVVLTRRSFSRLALELARQPGEERRLAIARPFRGNQRPSFHSAAAANPRG